MAGPDDFDRPRRERERDDYDDDPRPRPRPRGGEYGPLDKMFLDTAFPLLILFGLCCGMIALVLSIICLATAKQPEAKSKATTVAIISGVMIVVGNVFYFVVGVFGN